MKDKILVVEDSPAIQMVVESVLAEVADIKTVSHLKDADIYLKKEDVSMLILDVGLPDGDGFDFCSKLRRDKRYDDLKIIFMTGKTEINDRVYGLNLGADDYVVKPIEPREFLARVESRLRRRRATLASSEYIRHGFQVDVNNQRVIYAPEGHEAINLYLTPIEFRLFNHLLKNEGEVFSREILMETVWGKTVSVSEHTVDTHISSLRKKLACCAEMQLKAISKKGYCLRHISGRALQ